MMFKVYMFSVYFIYLEGDVQEELTRKNASI